MGLKGSEVMNLVNAIVPLYISIGLGYSLSKLKVLSYKVHYQGIVTFCFKVTTPPLVFQMVANNNPYLLNLRLIGADVLCKTIVLAALALSCVWRPTAQHVAWVSAYFNLATMSNTVLIGIPLLTALYPGTEKDITALVFLQCLIWFSVCIFILELHKVLIENDSKQGNEDPVHDVDVEKEGGQSGSGRNDVMNVEHRNGERVVNGIPAADDESAHKHTLDIDLQTNSHDKDDARDNALHEARILRVSKFHLVKRIMMTVAMNFVKSPIVWSSIIGFTYALLNFRFNDGKPLPVIIKSSVQLLANCTLGMAMFMLGMHMAAQPTLISCGLHRALMGAVLRFFVSPAVMAVASIIVGLNGEIFRFAVMQAMIPQAITSFVFACNYHVHEDIFSTAVWFQTLIFFPFALALYTILNLSA
ncbi:hypothetical protein Mapa_000949 [Marchantia paleacea]|nr:hypothetical protein Mapa_000949 [Marchantia paleacea]